MCHPEFILPVGRQVSGAPARRQVCLQSNEMLKLVQHDNLEKFMNVVFFGSSKYVIPIIEVLQKNFDLVLVITTEKQTTDPVPAYCIKSKVCYYVVRYFSKETLRQLGNVKATVGVLASFGAIVPIEVLQIFPKGIINIHPSLLPKYRGPTPVQTVILDGEKVTGVTIIKLDEEIDHGPILGQEKEEILATDTAESLYKRLFKKGANLLLKVLNNYLKGNLNPKAQDHKKATFTYHLTRQDGHIDVSNATTAVIKIDRIIRAYYPWPGTWTKLRIANRDVRIKFLPNNKLQVEGKKPMSYKDFLNGYPKIDKEILKKLSLNL